MIDIPRFGLSNLMGDEIHIKGATSFDMVDLHWHEYYELIYYYDADVCANINGSEHHLFGGSLYLLTPFDFHKTNNLREDRSIRFVNISFARDVLDTETASKISSAFVLLHAASDDSIISLIDLLYNNKNDLSGLNKKHLLSVLVDMIVMRGEAVSSESSFEGRSAVLNRVFDFVSRNFYRQITLSEIAEELHLAPAYFSALFSKTAGCTFIQYLTSFRLGYAKQLLLSTNKTVTQICFDCGFSSFSHFLREFKKWYGISPSKFRKSINP